jgi:hypothetical protein
MDLGNLVEIVKPYAVPIAIALVAGKALRRLLALPLEWLVRKTSNNIDNKILIEAEHDIGIDDPTLGGVDAPIEKK